MAPDPADANGLRAAAAQRRWRRVALAVPVSLLLGESLYGSLAEGSLTWYRFTTPLAMGLVGGIVMLRLLRRSWMRRWSGSRAPTGPEAERIARDALRFLWVAWSFAALAAGFGLVMFLVGAPRRYPYAFEVISIVYFLVYYPRRTVFDDLLWHPGENA